MPKPKRSPAARRTPSRWVRTESDRQAIREGCYFDQDAADHVCFFFETFLHHSKGRFGKQRFLLEPWQRDWLSMLFGWKRPDGTRRFREAYLEVAKKNGKSALCSGLALYGLFEEPGAEVYVGAVDRSQAAIILDEAGRMAEGSPHLARRVQVVRSKKSVFYHKGHAKLVAMSADAPSKDGVSGSLTILDETHRHKNDDLYNVMKYAGAARDQPLLINITTAGHDRHSLCYRLHSHAKGVIDGSLIDTEFYGVIYAADPKDDLDDPKTWRKANPSMGAVLKEADFRKAHAEAKLVPRLWNLFLRLRLNIWTEAEDRWLDVERWDELHDRDFDPRSLRGRPCYASVDLSARHDLSCTLLLFPYGKDFKNYRAVPYFYMPEGSIESREKRDKVPYSEWVAKGLIIDTPGEATDHEFIRRHLHELADLYEIKRLGIDPWNALHLYNLLDGDGLPMIGVKQRASFLNSPSLELESLIVRKAIRHDGNPCMRRCVAKVAVAEDAAGFIMPSKKKSTERIDGVVALVCAIALASLDKPKARPGIEVI